MRRILKRLRHHGAGEAGVAAGEVQLRREDEAVERGAARELRILNLEDSPVDARLIRATLRHEGVACEVVVVETREAFVAALEEGGFDLILSDYHLPSFDGFTAMEISHEIRPEVPFLIVSGMLGEENAIEALKRGATDYVLKDRLQRLAPAVRRAVREAEERTERRQAEAERERMFTLSLDLLCVAGLDGYFKRLNPAFEEVLGYTREELLSKPFIEWVHPEDREATLAELENLGAGQRTVSFENRYLREDGSVVWLAWKAVPVMEEGLIYASARDITESKRADASLRVLAEASSVLATPLDYQARLRNLTRIVVPDLADWCIVDMVEEDGGIKRLAVAHKNPGKVAWAREYQRQNPPDPDATTGVARVLKSGQPEFYPEITDEMLVASARDEEHLRVMREMGFTSVMMVPLIARGKTLGAITLVSAETGWHYRPEDLRIAETLARRAAMAIDNARLYEEARQEISRREEVEEELRASRDQLDVVLRGVADGITAQDASGRLIYANEAAARIVGYPTAQALMEAPVREVMQKFGVFDESGQPLPLTELPGRKALQDKQSAEAVLRFRVMETGEERWSIVGATPVLDERGEVRFAVNIFRDITERKLAEEVLIERSRLSALRADIAFALGKSGDSRTILQQVTEALVQHLDVAFARIWMLNEPENVLELQASAGTYTRLDGSYSRVKMGEFKIGRIAQNRQPHLTNDVLNDREISNLEWARQEAMVAFAGYPLIVEERVVGVVAMFAREPLGEGVLGELSPIANGIGQFIKRRRTEETLQLSEARFRNVVEQAPLSIQAFSPDGYTIRVNRAWEELWGANLEDIADYSILEDPQLVEKGIMPYIEKGFAGEPAAIPPVKYVPDETIPNVSNVAHRWVQAFIYPVKDEAGNIREVTLIHEDITERKQAEEALRESERRFRSLLEATNDVIWDVDLATNELRWSGAVQTMFGYSTEEVKAGQWWEDRLHPEDRQRVISGIEGVMNGHDDTWLEEYRFRCGDGSYASVIDRAFVLRGEGGEAIRIIGSMMDVSERKEAEEEIRRLNESLEHQVEERTAELEDAVTELKESEGVLRESEERFRVTFEQAAVGVAHVGTDGRWLRVNEKLCEILGYSREEMLGMSFRDITHPDDLGRDFEHVRRMLEGETDTYSTEKRYVRKDGALIWANLTTSLLRDLSGEPRYFISVTEDTTPRKEAEEALRLSEAHASLALDVARLGTWSWDPARDEFLADARCREVCGLDPDAPLSLESITPHIHPDDWPRIEAALGAALQPDGDGRYAEEFRFVHLDGAVRWVISRGQTLFEGETRRPTLLIGTVLDITERKRAEEELMRLASFPELNPNPIIETSIEGEPTYLNPAAERRFPDVRALGPHHPMLADLGPAARKIRSSHGRPCVREIQAGGRFYQQVISAVPENGLLRVYATDITERRRAEEETRRNNMLLDAIIEGTDDPVFLKDLEGRYMMVNSATAMVMGLSEEEILGKSDAELLPPEVARALMEVDRGVMSTGETDVYEEQLPVEGETRTFLSTKAAYRDPTGEISGLIGVAHDITERRRAEDALRESEELYRAVVEQAAENIFLVDPRTGRILEANPSLAASLGYPAEDLREMTLYDIIASDRESIERNIQLILAERKRNVGERLYRHRDGSLVHVEVNASVIPYEGSDALCVVAHDVSERKRAEVALRESEERFRTLTDAAFEGIAITEDGKVLDANRAFCELFGYEISEVRGMFAAEFHPPEYQDEVRQKVSSGYREAYESVGLRKDGAAFDVEIHGRNVVHGGRGVRMTALRDITGRKRAEETLREVREAERNRIARDLHDVILQDITDAMHSLEITQLKAGEPEIKEDLDDEVGVLERSVMGLRNIVYDLRLSEARGEYPFTRLLESLVNLNRQRAPGCEISLHIEDGVPALLSRKGGMELMNVIREALVNVRRHSGARHAQVVVSADDDEIRAEIADDGRGFDSKSRDSGVGLFSMRERAGNLRGELEVESEQGNGTRVVVRVPLQSLLPDGSQPEI